MTASLAQEPMAPENGNEAPRANFVKRVAQFEVKAGRVPRRELMHFSRQMAVFIRAGIPILEALDAIREEVTNKRLREVLDDMSDRLRAGDNFATSLGRHADVFPAFYLGMIDTAEVTGRLDDVFDRLGDYIERDIDARQKVLSALTYPAVVIGLAVFVVIVLTVYVMPKFQTLFKSLDAKLPLPTRILLDVSHAISTYWYLVLGIPALLVIACMLAWRTERGRYLFDKLILGAPAVGTIVRFAILERFCRVLAAMTTAGVPLSKALDVSAGATANRMYKEKLAVAREEMLRGEGLAGPLSRSGVFPGAARQMLAVGEASGTLDIQLETAATYFDRELNYRLKRFTNLFEPAVIMVVGVLVGFVAIAMVSAMYGIYRQVKV